MEEIWIRDSGSVLRVCPSTKPSQDQWKESLRDSFTVNLRSRFTVILDSSMVEHAAVNRGVVGSSPTRGVVTAVTKVRRHQGLRTFCCLKIFCKIL